MDLVRHTATARERYVEPAKRPAEAEADGQISDSASQIEGVADPQSAAPAKRRVCRKGLRNAEARYRRLLQGLPAVVCELAADGRTLSVNAAASRVLGYQPTELLGRHWWDTLCPGELNQQVDRLSRQLQSGDVGDFEMVLQASDGSLKTLAWSFATEYLADGTPECVVGFGVDVTEHQRVDEELKHSVAKLRGALEGTVEAMAMTVEIRDPYTAGHQRRVAALGCAIATELGLSEEQINAIRLAGTIHDIGKISVPVELLSKHGRMQRTELDLIKAHPEVGYAILKMIDFPWPVAQIVHQHHERIDGSGYPRGLQGDDILLEARILAVADVVESMAGPRPYRPALGVDKAIQEISEQRGILYDPGVVDACLKIIREIELD